MTEETSFRTRLAALRPAGIRLGLETMRLLLAELGHPERTLGCVHVAGTNGKGATCAMLDAILRAAGYRTARYASPHLLALNERFFLDGEPVSDAVLEAVADELFAAADRVAAAGREVTFFECLTATAFLIFARARPDVTIVETGLGGRDDATNVLADPLVTVLTRIGCEHCDLLGSTVAEIADVKAGILKPGRPVVCGAMPGEARAVIARRAAQAGCAVFSSDGRSVPPTDRTGAGTYMAENAATAVTVADVLRSTCGFEIPERAIREGLERFVWPGRFQRVTKDGVAFIVDGAHNPDGTRALCAALRASRVAGPFGFVCGFCEDKDVAGNLRTLAPLAGRGWAVPFANARAMAPRRIAERMAEAGFASPAACASPEEGLCAAANWARASGGTIIVCGSLFLAGEALVALGAYPWPLRTADANETR